MADPHADVWTALQALPKPVTRDAALVAAATVLDPLGRTQQFSKWFEVHGDLVLARLNG